MFMVGVDSAKEQIYSRLKLTTPGPGYCHFPVGRDERYYSGLTSEVVHTRYSKGFPVREWKLKPNTRNEPLDCRVYAYAALCSLNVNWRRSPALPRLAGRPSLRRPRLVSLPSAARTRVFHSLPAGAWAGSDYRRFRRALVGVTGVVTQ